MKEAIAMLTTRVFQNGNSQAIRIPQELRTDTNEMTDREQPSWDTADNREEL